MNVVCCFIKEQFFADHKNYIKMLDPDNITKQAHRTYLCLKITADSNDYYIPLRNNLGADVRPYGRIGHSVPSRSRSDAGLDFRYALIINDSSYIEIPETPKIPNVQLNRITNDYYKIEHEFKVYLNGFRKALRKGRIQLEALYRESSLINFTNELSL